MSVVANKHVANKKREKDFNLTAKAMNILMQLPYMGSLFTFSFSFIIAEWLWKKHKFITYRINEKLKSQK